MRGAVHTAVATASFDKVRLSADSTYPGAVVNVTFSLREVRHALSFAQAPAVGSQEIALFFNEPGAPVMVSTTAAVARPFTLDLVVATMEQPVLPAPGSPLTQMQDKGLAGGGGGGGAAAGGGGFAATSAPLHGGGGGGGGGGGDDDDDAGHGY